LNIFLTNKEILIVSTLELQAPIGCSDNLLVRVYVAPNTNSDGSDNPVGRAQNRRTEFRVFSNIIK